MMNWYCLGTRVEDKENEDEKILCEEIEGSGTMIELLRDRRFRSDEETLLSTGDYLRGCLLWRGREYG